MHRDNICAYMLHVFMCGCNKISFKHARAEFESKRAYVFRQDLLDFYKTWRQ